MSTFNEESLRAELDLTKGEEDLIAAAETGTTSQINKTRIWSTVYSVKHIKDAVADLISSNEDLSRSNDRHARSMNFLTGGLLVVAVIQIIVQFVK